MFRGLASLGPRLPGPQKPCSSTTCGPSRALAIQRVGRTVQETGFLSVEYTRAGPPAPQGGAFRITHRFERLGRQLDRLWAGVGRDHAFQDAVHLPDRSVAQSIDDGQPDPGLGVPGKELDL